MVWCYLWPLSSILVVVGSKWRNKNLSFLCVADSESSFLARSYNQTPRLAVFLCSLFFIMAKTPLRHLHIMYTVIDFPCRALLLLLAVAEH